MTIIQNPSSLCCLLNPDGKCSACTLKLCAGCFRNHLQTNDLEVQLNFMDIEGNGPYVYHTRMKCSLLGRPSIYVMVDTLLKL